MISKTSERSNAIALRKRGFSYTQILTQVPVAKSTLSLWLRSVSLSKRQKYHLTKRRVEAALRGARAKRIQRLARTEKIKKLAHDEIRKLVKDPFWLAGLMLYWAEGTKQKDWEPSKGVTFTNMDVEMLKLFQSWIKKYLGDQKLVYEVYIHQTADIESAKRFWSKELSAKRSELRVYLKKHNSKRMRHNIGVDYHGTIRIMITRSTDLNRKIAGWIEGVVEYCK